MAIDCVGTNNHNVLGCAVRRQVFLPALHGKTTNSSACALLCHLDEK